MNKNEMTIARAWLSFREKCINPNASDYQVKDMKMAFYGGASIMGIYIGTMYALDATPQEISEIFTKIEDELIEYRDKHHE
jgi:hypothetical protein